MNICINNWHFTSVIIHFLNIKKHSVTSLSKTFQQMKCKLDHVHGKESSFEASKKIISITKEEKMIY